MFVQQRPLDPRIEQARACDILAVAVEIGARFMPAPAMAVERCGPCPVCGGKDRFGIHTRLRVWNCRGCQKGGDVIALAQHLLGLDFGEAIEFITGAERRATTRKPAPIASPAKAVDDADNVRNLASAACIGREIRPVKDTPGETYLRDVRGIDTAPIADVLERTDAIGWHPSVYFNEPGHPLHGRRLGAIVGIMSDARTNKLTGAISRTYIGPDGKKLGKAMTLGRPAGIVRLSWDDDVCAGLMLAEGIETGLDAMSLGLRPLWCTGSTSLMASFPPLGGIMSITVIADNDPSGAGLKAARALEATWLAGGHEIRIFMADQIGDLNDMTRSRSL